MLIMMGSHLRYGCLVNRAACCQVSLPSLDTKDGTGTHNPPTPCVAAASLQVPPATPSVESGRSPTLWIWGDLSICPGRVLPGHFSWEDSALALVQSCSLTHPTPPLLALIYLIGHRKQ